jgi:hypothetical protein
MFPLDMKSGSGMAPVIADRARWWHLGCHVVDTDVTGGQTR